MSSSLTFFTPNIPTLNPTTTPKPKPKLKLKKPKNNNTQTQRFSIPKCSLTTTTTFSDPFVLQLAESLEDSLPTTTTTSKSPPLIQKIRDNSSQSLLTTPWPSRKHESFRFTDLSLIRNSQLYPVRQHPDNLKILETDENNVVVVADGFVGGFGTLGSDQNGIFIGRVGDLGDESVVLERVRECMCDFEFGDLFWSVNGMGFQDLVVVYVPSGCRVERPVCFRYVAVEGGEGGVLPVSNPRALVVVEKGGEVGIVEEFVGGEDGVGGKCYWMNSVLEVVVGEGGKVTHSYVQSQSLDAAHTKWTSVRQESASSYELVEVSTGGKLSRHNLHIQQLGPDTSTKLSTLHVSTSDQTQDLHSRLVLDHPRGYSQQLHKCIVAHSQGQAVFDGNVKVNRYAQQTDAGQLTRSLLLEPRATVNLKPNLQIIADDVKCSHGAAISDLEDSQLFYFLARGIDLETARKALIVSFAKEVIERLPHKYLRDKVDSLMKELLDPAR